MSTSNAASPSLTERAIMGLAPQWAARRYSARMAMQSATALGNTLASVDTPDHLQGQPAGSPLRWWRPGVRDAAADSLHMLQDQRGQSREMVRTSGIAAGAINTNVDRVVGTGLVPVPTPDRRVLGWSQQQAEDFSALVRTEFSLWADSPECDSEGEFNFYEKQDHTLRSTLVSGDCFTVLPDGAPTSTQPYRLRLQTVEADRIGNPLGQPDTDAICAGIRRASDAGLIDAYYVYDRHPGSVVMRAGMYKGQWVDRMGGSGRRRMLHHFRRLRPGQPRGIPYLAPVVDLLKQLTRYTEAEIHAAVVSAFFTVFIETPQATGPAPVFAGQTSQGPAGPSIDLAPGAVVGLAAGEQAKFANPLRPNTAFDGFVQAILTQVGMGLNIPRDVLMKSYDASYSAARAALLDAWMWFRSQRTWLSRTFCQPVFETWLAEAVATNRIPAPGFFADPLLRWAYTRATWHGDSQGSINPKDEVAAYTAAIDQRLMSRERAEWELFGTDWYASLDGKEREQQLLINKQLLPVPKAGAAAPIQQQGA